MPGHLPERLLRGAPAALRGGRLRLSRGRPDHRQRHQRQAHPPAGRRRALRRALRRRWSRTAARSTCAPGVLRREVHWRSPAGREIKVRSVRLVSFVHRSVAAIRYEVEPLDGETRIVVQSELVANEDVPARSPRIRARGRDPARAARLASGTAPTSCAPCSCTARGPARLRMAAGMDHEVEGPRGHGHRERELRRPRAGDGQRRGRPRRDADADQVPGLRVVQPALDGLDPRPGRRCARVGAAHGVRRPPRRPARVPRRLLGARGRRDRRRRRAPAGRALRPLPHAAVRRPRGEARDRGQGADGRRLRRARLLGHRELRAARAHLHRARGRPRRARRGATRRSTSPPSARASCASTAPRSRGGRSAARSARPTGRRARPPSTSTPTSPTPCCATCTRPTTTSSRAGRGSSCWSRPRGCGARWATTTRAAPSTSTGSPGPTSTRRSPTTTSTRTSWPPGTWPARRSRAARHREEAAALGVGDEEMAAWRDAAGAIARALRRRARGPRAVGGLHAPRALGLRGDGARRVPAAAALPLLRPLPQAGRQAGRPRARDDRRPAIASRRATRRAPSPTTSRSPCATRRCRRACRPIMAAEVGHLELAFDYFGEAALMDLDDLEHNTRDGLHMASLAGSWLAAVAGFGGFRDHEGAVLLRPAAAAAPRAPGLRAHAARAPAARGDRAGRGALRAGRRRADRAAPRSTRRSRSSAGARRRIRGVRRRPASRPCSPRIARPRGGGRARSRLTAGAVLRWLDRGLPPPQARRKTLPGPRLRGVFLVRPRP